MAERMGTVYYADNFSYSEQKPYELIQLWIQEGSLIEARMPTPTRKHPEKTKLVYKWIGERMQQLRDDSAMMPPRVMELAADGSRMHLAFAFSYRGIMMGGASRPVMVPA